MPDLTATEAARRFSDLLDAVEHAGETFVITRRGRPVARISPAPAATAAEIIGLLEGLEPDPEWWRAVEDTRKLLRLEERAWPD